MRLNMHIRQFARGDSGTMLVTWGLTFVVLLGIAAMSFDLGRTGITRSELQAFTDNVALAAAGELDGKDDAITRARAAAANLISDRKTFGTGGSLLSGDTDYTLTFYSELPEDDTAVLTAVTGDPAEAVFVRAEAAPSTVGAYYGAAFAALTGTTRPNEQARASSVAGFTQYACDITPLMFCIPPGFSADASIGEMILLRSGGNGSAWGPGDFGFLDPAKVLVDDDGPCAGLNGAQLDACLLGAEGSITQCFSQRGVDIEPGQKVGIRDAIFNVRFDIYKAIMNGKRNNPDYPPAPNVIKGVVPNGGGSCIGSNEEVSPDTVGLPRDDCFGSGGCSRYGDGNWAAGRAAYVDTNYGGTDPHPGASTRYEYYLEEINAAGGPGGNGSILSGLSETGRPVCSPNQSADPQRRVVIAAGIDCTANPISGSTTDVPVEEFVKLFLTEPVGDDGASPPTVDIWGEVVGSAGGGAGGTGDAGIFRDVVQLYR
ncbi:Tad domain-containing protein [Leisingera daeponensis]|uniref:Tad domain-containing protein n=2 Tax=Leisingera daeponensis TaxID=405746 RepID=A0ABS7NEA4_9RHOB|nr:Tad domain-containing protein [Leisingera daeponensis]